MRRKKARNRNQPKKKKAPPPPEITSDEEEENEEEEEQEELIIEEEEEENEEEEEIEEENEEEENEEEEEEENEEEIEEEQEEENEEEEEENEEEEVEDNEEEGENEEEEEENEEEGEENEEEEIEEEEENSDSTQKQEKKEKSDKNRSIRPRPIDVDIKMPIFVGDFGDVMEGHQVFSSTPLLEKKINRNSKLKEVLDDEAIPLMYHNSLITEHKLEVPSCVVLKEDDKFDPWVRPQYYVIYQEKSEQMLEDTVEYECDSQDEEFVERMNKKHKKLRLSLDTFESIVDGFEKFAWKKKDELLAAKRKEEDILCSVCGIGESDDLNMIVLCDGCDVAVHQMCYGVERIPEDEWLCEPCQLKIKPDCYLCKQSGGALKPTINKKWCHVVCALWTPGMSIEDTTKMKPIDGINNVPREYLNRNCSVCKKKGCCIQCKARRCTIFFHPHCGMKARLYMKIKPGKNQTFTYECFCRSHRRLEEDSPILKYILDFGAYSAVITSPSKPTKGKSKARKTKEEEIEDNFVLPEILVEVAEKLSEDKKVTKEVVQNICKYWIDRRRKLNKPLLRRFQEFAQVSDDKKRFNSEVQRKGHEGGGREGYSTMRAIRNGMEKARMLLELLKKRELAKKERLENVFKFMLISLNHSRALPEDHSVNFHSEIGELTLTPAQLELVKNNENFNPILGFSAMREADEGKASRKERHSMREQRTFLYPSDDEKEANDGDFSANGRERKRWKTSDGQSEAAGLHCHHCKRRRDRVVFCPFNKTHRYCSSCTLRHFKLDFDELADNPMRFWKKGCPKCKGLCPCATCRNEKEKKKEKASNTVEEEVITDSPLLGQNSQSEVDKICCSKCGSGKNEENLMLCDGKDCNVALHISCHKPALKKIPEGEWFCNSCKKKTKKKKK